QGWQHITYGASPLAIIFGAGRPLVRILGLLFFGNIPMNVFPLTIYTLTFHVINAFLVFLITYQLSRKSTLSIIAALFFAVNSVDSQSVSWFGAAFGLMPSSFFILLSLYFTTLFLKTKLLKYTIYAFVAALVSVFFKEDGLFLFVFIPIVVILSQYSFSKTSFKRNFVNFIKSRYIMVTLIFVIYLLLFVSYRYTHMVKMAQAAAIPVPNTQSILPNVFTNIIVYPLSTFSLIYIPPEVSLPLTENFTKYYLPTVMASPSSDAIIQNIVLEALAIFFAFIVLFLIQLIYVKEKDLRLLIKFSTLLLVLCMLPYVVVIRGFTYLEPRYYYIASAAAGIYLGSFGYLLYRVVPFKRIGVIIVGLLLISFYSMHISVIREQMHKQVVIATERKNIINQVYAITPSLHQNNNVFYVTGNRDFTVPNNKVPFQQGFGYTLMVLYFKRGTIPNDLLANGFLWDTGSQGYQNVNGKGFGFFTNLNDLKKSLKENNLSKNNVIALYYNSNTEKVTDITKKLDLR
ncbi:MAG: hypothetical protein ACREHC_03320, partial [Candidatus Levyibacteriota bacterium]